MRNGKWRLGVGNEDIPILRYIEAGFSIQRKFDHFGRGELVLESCVGDS